MKQLMLFLFLSFCLTSTTGFAGEIIRGRILVPENNNPCTNGTYPKPAGCFQKNYNSGNYNNSNNRTFQPNRQEIDRYVNTAIQATQQLILQQKRQERVKTSRQMADGLAEELTNYLMGLANRTNNVVDQNNFIASMNNKRNLSACLYNDIVSNDYSYNRLYSAKSRREAFFLYKSAIKQCTPFIIPGL